MSALRIEKGGHLSLPTNQVQDLGGRPLRISNSSSRHLVLEVEDSNGKLLMAGSLGDLAIVDLLSFFNMFRKSGRLLFSLLAGSKELYFKNGEIIFATSTFPEEEIGEILYGLGKVDRKTLTAARQKIKTPKSLGRFLVDQGVISSQDLWAATRGQVEAIIYSLFTFHEGSFAFFDWPLLEAKALSLSMNTQNLIMEGLRRIDERALYMQKVKSLDAVPILTGQVPNDLDSTSQKMLALIKQGVSDVKDLLRSAGTGEFDGLRLLNQLVERGVVTMEETPTVAVEGTLGEVIHIFNGVLSAMYRVVALKNPQFRQEVSAFLRQLPQPFSYVFRQASLKEDGSVDGGRILANLSGLEEGDKFRLLTEALSELVYMECIAVRRELGPLESADLIKRVQDVSKRVQALNQES
jgi:hypothetical protein